jgi:lactoylglutathione lyase
MFNVDNLFEAHLNVTDLSRSMHFYGTVLGLPLEHFSVNRRVAFYWIGERGQSMLGLWETGSGPQIMRLHVAFRVSLQALLQAPAQLKVEGIVPLDFDGKPIDEPVVLAWMPAASVYFHDTDGNLLEFLTMLPDAPRPELGVLSWTDWKLALKREEPS